MTTQSQIQLDADTIKELEQRAPMFLLKLLVEAEELRQYQDILEACQDEATEGLNPVDIESDDDAYFDYDCELNSALWSIIHKKLGITDEMLKSIED